MNMSIIAASRLREKPFVAKIFIGGVDATKYATAQGFSDFFRAVFDPTNPVVVPVSDILSYQTEPDGNGRLNIELEIQGQKAMPNRVFSNTGGNSGSLITYFIDAQQVFTSLDGVRQFAVNPLKHVLLRDLTNLSSGWNREPLELPDVLDFEGLQVLDDLYFDDYRNANDRINIRNATNFLADPATDSVLRNYNLNSNDNAKKVIYVHPSMATINNGSPFNSLQLAINRGADVRYVNDTTTIPQEPTGITIQEVGATYVILDFTDVTSADFYNVFKDNFENPVEQFFPIQEIINGNKFVFGLTPNTFYRFKLQTFDVNYNKSPKSNSISFTTPATPALFQNAIAYYKLDETSGQTIDVVNGFNGTLVGGVTQGVTGKIGNAYSFDGVDGRVDLPASIYNVFDNNNYTVSFWFKTNDVTKSQLLISDFDGSDFTKRKLFAFIDGSNQKIIFSFGDNGGNEGVNSATVLQNNTWYFLQLKYDGNADAQIKVNNVLENSYTFINPPQTQNQISLGQRKPFPSFPFDGELDEVSLINGQTTLGQDSDLYNNGNGTTI